MRIDALSELCAQLTRDLLAIAKFLFCLPWERPCGNHAKRYMNEKKRCMNEKTIQCLPACTHLFSTVSQLFEPQVQKSPFSRTAAHIFIANLSVCLSVRNVPVSDENCLTYRHNFSPYDSPIKLVLPASNIFTKFRRGHPPAGALNTGGI